MYYEKVRTLWNLCLRATNPVMLRLRNEIMRYIWPVGQNGKSRYPLKVEFYEFESHTGHHGIFKCLHLF